MVRPSLLLAGLAIGMALGATGCRSCSSCHDYDAPVANCDCNSCGTHRAGSASGGYSGGEYVGGEYSDEEQIIDGSVSGDDVPEMDETQ